MTIKYTNKGETGSREHIGRKITNLPEGASSCYLTSRGGGGRGEGGGASKACPEQAASKAIPVPGTKGGRQFK